MAATQQVPNAQQRRVLEHDTTTFLGWDENGRPCVEAMTGIPYRLQRWAVLRSGDPADIVGTITAPQEEPMAAPADYDDTWHAEEYTPWTDPHPAPEPNPTPFVLVVQYKDDAGAVQAQELPYASAKDAEEFREIFTRVGALSAQIEYRP